MMVLSNYDGGSKNEYIFSDEVSVIDKLWDLDELIKWGENKEMYTECQVLLDMKKEIIANRTRRYGK